LVAPDNFGLHICDGGPRDRAVRAGGFAPMADVQARLVASLQRTFAKRLHWRCDMCNCAEIYIISRELHGLPQRYRISDPR
jgi:hypothetical protein